MRLATGLFICMTALACGFRHARQAEPAIRLEAHNRSPFDVDVYALPSLGTQTRVRLGNVTGFTTATLQVPRHALRAGHSLILYLHAIGSNQSWVSPEVTVGQDVVPCLDIHSDPSGNLDRSVFYSRVASDDSGTCGANNPQQLRPKGEFADAGVSRYLKVLLLLAD